MKKVIKIDTVYLKSRGSLFSIGRLPSLNYSKTLFKSVESTELPNKKSNKKSSNKKS